MKRISIIMPIYNAEKFLHRAIDSIISQTFLDWELLLIDDGSQDKSPQICDQYTIKDSRIRTFHKTQNEGVAMARKTGMDNAIGEYSIHFDADDWAETTMLEELYNKAKNDNIDIVIADYYVNSGKRQTISKQQPTSITPAQILQDIFDNKLLGSLCNKLIKTKLYKEYQAHFFNGINHCEDLLILVQLLQNNNLHIAYIPKAYYHYFMNESSITHNFTYKTYEVRLRFRDKLTELLTIPQKDQILERTSFGIFTEALIYNVLSHKEIRQGIKKYKIQIKHTKSLKWKIGFYLFYLGFNNLAKKFIHY